MTELQKAALRGKLIEHARKLKPNSGLTVPESTEANYAYSTPEDGYVESGGLEENLTYGHITGTGGPIKSGNALPDTATSLDEEESLNNQAKAWNEAGKRRYTSELGYLNNPTAEALASKGIGAHRIMMSNPVTAGLGYGLGAAGLYAGLNWWRNRGYQDEEEKARARRNTLLLGLAGAGLGVGLRKRASFSDPMAIIRSKLLADTSLPYNQQQQLLAQTAQLPFSQQLTLANAIGSMVGAGVGAMIAKFLFGSGGIGTGIAAGIGGLLGFRSRFPKTPGVNNSVDFFGRSI